MLKKLLAIVGGLIAIVVIGVAILIFVTPTEFKMSREVVINKPKADVMNYVKLLKNQSEWGPWIKRDPQIALTYKGTDGEKGFVAAWDSKDENLGAGEQEITRVDDGTLETALRFKRPMEAENDAVIEVTEVSPTQSKVRWSLSGKLTRPGNLMYYAIDKLVGPDFEKGLADLKTIMEKK